MKSMTVGNIASSKWSMFATAKKFHYLDCSIIGQTFNNFKVSILATLVRIFKMSEINTMIILHAIY